MKTKLFALVTILILSLSVSVKAQTWEYVNTLQNEWLQKVCTQGLDTVYIVGQNGLIAKSTNRALTWNKQYISSKTTLNDVIFINHTIGFAVGANGTIIKTTDAGTNWTLQTSGTTNNLNAIAATGLNNIWSVGDNGSVIQSTDTGKTWIAKSLLSNNKQLNDIKFNGITGYIAGNDGTVLKTSNAGSLWGNNNINWAPENGSISTFAVRSLSITNNKLFALLYDYTFGTLIFSDGSGAWSKSKDSYGRSIMAGSVYFIDDNQGYYAAYDFTTGSGFVMWIYKTTDGGQNWQETSINNYYGSINQFSNFSFNSNHSYGYFICGNIILRTPYTGDFTTGLNYFKKELHDLKIAQHGDELQVSSPSKTISQVDILSLTGIEICQRKNNVINIQQVPAGVYLIRATYTDNSKSSLAKWIKH